MEAINIIGREVMLPRGLVRLGLDTLDQSGPEIREALSLYSETRALPILVHCTQGKDRTGGILTWAHDLISLTNPRFPGLITALILMILGVPKAAIERDYSLTDVALVSDRPDRVLEIRELGLTDDWADTHPDMISAVQDHVDSEYGGLDAYLDHIGFGETDRSNVRKALLY